MREEQKREADRVQQERAIEFKRSLEANHAEVFERPPPPKEKTKGLLCQMVLGFFSFFLCFGACVSICPSLPWRSRM